MALPETREETLAPGSQVKSATLNAIQDAIIVGRYHGDIEEEVPLPIFPAAYGAGGLTGDTAAGQSRYTGLASDPFVVKLPVKVGRRLKHVLVRAIDQAPSAFTVEVFKQSVASGAAPGAPASLGSYTSTGISSANVQAVDVTIAAGGQVATADLTLSVHITLPTSSHELLKLAMVYDYPNP
jgi:hypothetical protein